uniref:hypothetical protein n=1 Tax=Paractinoplanes polyasparticus TaxID=2856853 RepID=UPI001C84404E|nr:hypothetical protein [Actinoplanes polyasparticus]
MPDETRADLARLADLAASVGSLMTECRQHAEALYGYSPAFGDFDVAQWLGETVTDRRDAVLAHVAYLDRALAELAEVLERVPAELGEVDAANATVITGLEGPHHR